MYLKKMIEKRLEVLRGNEHHLVGYIAQLESDTRACNTDLINCRDEIKELEAVLAWGSEEKHSL